MALTTLLKIGTVRNLPDPPVGNFNTKKVNLSDEAFSYGGPDSPVNILAHAANILLASIGGADRADSYPYLPVAAAGLSRAQAAIAAKSLFYQMPFVDKARCPYCVDASVHSSNFALTLPGSRGSLRPGEPR